MAHWSTGWKQCKYIHVWADLPECSKEKCEEGPQEGEVRQQNLYTPPVGVAPQDIKAEHREGGTPWGLVQGGRKGRRGERRETQGSTYTHARYMYVHDATTSLIPPPSSFLPLRTSVAPIIVSAIGYWLYVISQKYWYRVSAMLQNVYC